MLSTFEQNVNLERLKLDAFKIGPNTVGSDIVSYPEFLKYFNDINILSKHNLIIGINFTYGWMPTIFDFRSNKLKEVIEILNSAKSGTIPTIENLKILRNCLNNSLVGTSKILHFINPKNFAIWDSRVYRYLTNSEPYSYRLDNFSAYLDYLIFCNNLTSRAEYEPIHLHIVHKIGYEMSKFRTMELIMYTNRDKPGKP